MVHRPLVINSIGLQDTRGTFDCTAVGTPFGSVVSISFVNGNLKHFAVGFKKFLEFAVGNPVNLLVGFPVKLSSFASDILGKVYNFFADLSASCLGKISLLGFKFPKALTCPVRTLVGKTFGVCSSLYKSVLLFGNIPAKIKLSDNFFLKNNRNPAVLKKGNIIKACIARVFNAFSVFPKGVFRMPEYVLRRRL